MKDRVGGEGPKGSWRVQERLEGSRRVSGGSWEDPWRLPGGEFEKSRPFRHLVGTCFGGLTCPNQKTILARYTNWGVINIPSCICFTLQASLKKVGHPSTMGYPFWGVWS